MSSSPSPAPSVSVLPRLLLLLALLVGGGAAPRALGAAPQSAPEAAPGAPAANAAPAASAAGLPAEPVDAAAIRILRHHGLEKSQVMEHLSWICDVHGPRLTGSPQLRRAQDWAVETLRGFGLADCRTEEWGPFGLGWQLERFSAHVVGDNPWQVLAIPKAWSPSIQGRVEAEVVDVTEMGADQLRALDLSDKIVLLSAPRELSEPFEGAADRYDAGDLEAMETRERSPREQVRQRRQGDFRRGFRRRTQVLRLVHAAAPIAILDSASKGDYGTVFVAGASIPAAPGTPRSERPRVYDPKGAKVVPQFTIAAEHLHRIQRLLKKGIPVRMALELKARFFDGDRMERNVLAEIPGTDPDIGREVVMLGAHLDSWHSATGATDNGCGSAVMIEAMRILKVLVDEKGRGPRRTIRIGLWSGEEQGLLGSRAYVRQHYADGSSSAHRDFAGYFNLDNGTGRIRGVYLQENEAVGPIFRAWLRPFHDLDAKTIHPGNTGGTDHLAFDAVGLPGFQFIQDPIAYGSRTHHSSMDHWDHAIAADLRQAATIIAAFAWHSAQRDEKLPRKMMAARAPVPATTAEPATAPVQEEEPRR